jgi:hypothetical protein
MHEMINGRVFIPDEGLGTEQETQVEFYDIDMEPLFGQYGNTIEEDTVVDDESDNKGDVAMDGAYADADHDADEGKKRKTSGP